MTRAPLALLALPLALVACSQGATAGDTPRVGSAAGTGIPAAATGARVGRPPMSSASAGPPSAPGDTTPPYPQGRSPRLREGTPTLTGAGLPPEVVRRIVRQNFGRFRLCYENGLRSDPTLGGTVTTRFVIGADGAVSVVSDAGSDLPDEAVVACIDRGFGALSFPSPSSSAVAVIYPIYFTPPSPVP